MIEQGKTKNNRGRNRRIIIFCTITLFFVSLLAHPLLNKIIEKQVEEKLRQLSPLVQVHFSGIDAEALSSSVSIDDLSIKFQPDTSDHLHQHALLFSKADITGIDFFEALFNNKLSANHLKLSKGEIDLDEFLLEKDSLPNHHLNMPFKTVSVDHFETEEMNMLMHSDHKKKLLFKGFVYMDKCEINLSSQPSAKKIHFASVQCKIFDVNYSLPALNQTLQIKQLILNSKRGILRIDSLKTQPDAKNDSVHSGHFFVSNIQVSKLDVMQLINKKLISGTIIINECHADIFIAKLHESNLKENKLPVAMLNDVLDEIRIDSLIIKNSTATLENKILNDKTNKIFTGALHFKSFSIGQFIVEETYVKLHLRTTNQFKIEKFDVAGFHISSGNNFNYASVAWSISHIHYPLPHSYRTIHIGDLILDSKKQFLKISNLKLSTDYSKFELGRKLGYQADYIEARIPTIQISKLNFTELFHGKFVAEEADVNNATVYFFRDRRLPRLLKEQPMPNDYLRKIPIELHVNSCKINNASVVSEEFPKAGDHSGILRIGKINISMSPMINHADKSDVNYSTAYVKASIMNAGLITVTIRAPLIRNIYSVKGAIKNLNLPALNPSAENLGRFHIESGILNSLDFHFTATEEKATGAIVGEYHNLIIDRLKEKNGEKKIAKIPTFFLKHFIIQKNKDKSLDVAKRTGKIDYKRDPTRFVTFYFLKALLDGIRASFDLGFLLPK